MANPNVIGQFALADPNENPIVLNDLIRLLNQLLSIQIQGSYTPYVLQHAVPAVEDQDKAWIELDEAGRPTAIKVWYAGNPGAWRRVYNGMIGEIRGYTGNPNDDFDMTGDNPGRGLIGEKYDGWYLCNGLNGTPNLSDKFLLGAHMDDSNSHEGYDNGWQSSLPWPDGTTHDQKTGGTFTRSILNDATAKNLPALTNAQPGDDPGLWIYGKQAKEEADHPGTLYPLVDSHYANAIDGMNINLTAHVVTGSYGKDPPDPLWTTPPFISLGWITFRGY